MSIWCHVTGFVAARRDAHISIKKMLESICDESNISIESSGYGHGEIHERYISWSFCADGINAALIVESFINKLRVSDKTAAVDLTAEIRWL